ncbi:MAG: LysR family transcriptional regulator, partial [Streptosporangiaceae bacterium]
RQPGRCDLTGLPLPPPRRPRGGTVTCTSDPAATPAIALPPGGHVLAAQQHISALISALLASRGRPAETAALQQYLDDVHAVARAAASAVTGTAAPPTAATAVLEELAARPVPGAAASVLASAAGGRRRQLAPVTAFGITIADIMLHGRPSDPDPDIAGWLASNGASRRNTSSPANILAQWDHASPALQAALVRPLATRLDTFYQLRYRAVAGLARVPDPGRAEQRATALPSLMWPGWALRLIPPESFDFLRYRAALAMMLAIAATGATDYATAQDLLGLESFPSSRLATFTARLRQHEILEPVTAAICQLARKLEEHGAPVGYARRRRLRRLSQAQLDIDAWRRQRCILTRHASLPAAPVQEQYARLRLIELLTGTHPRYLPEPLRLPGRSQGYTEFTFTLPEQMARQLDQQARSLLAHSGIHEPVTWEPPFDWVTGIPWPGPDPDGISPADLHPLIRAGLPVRAIAARLGTTADHVRLTAARHPAPQLPPGTPAQPPPEPGPPRTDQLRALTGQGYGPRKIARITGCSERTIKELLTSAGLRQPAPHPGGTIDPHWLREQYQDHKRSLKDIAAETGIPVEALAAAARQAGIRVRHGISGRAHPLATFGGPGAFPPDVWSVFAHPGAEQRIRRLLALPGQPGLHHAARQLGIRNAILTSQVRQLETTVGTPLLRTGPDGQLTLTAYGKLFARDVRPALESLAQSRKSTDSNHGTLPLAPPETVHLPGNQPRRQLFN